MLNKTAFYLALALLLPNVALAQGFSTEGQARPKAVAPATPAPQNADAPAPVPPTPNDTGGEDTVAEESWDADPEAEPAPAPTPAPAAAPQAGQPAAEAAGSGQPAPRNEPVAQSPQPTAPAVTPAPEQQEQTPADAPAPAEAAPAGQAAAPGAEMTALEEGQLLINERANTAVSPGYYGFAGVFRTISAFSGKRNSMRFGAHAGGYYLTGEWDDSNHTHLEGRGHLAYSILDELEVRIDGIGTGHRIIPNKSGEDPEFIQTLGDIALGGKYSYIITDYLSAAGLLDFRFYTKLRSMGFRWGSFSMMPMAALTFDARRQPDVQWPLVAHVNLGFFLDNSSKVLVAGNDDLTFDADLTASRLNALNVRTGNQMLFNLAVEFPQDIYTVYLEYSTEQETGNKLQRGVRKGHWNQSPQRFTPGVRWNFVDRLLLDFAVDIAYGLSEEYTVNGVAARPTTPYQFWTGLTYSYDPESAKVIDTRGYVKGIVVDAETGEPIGGAVVQYPGNAVTRQVTRMDDGNFVSFPLVPGQAKIRIVKEKYEPVVISPTIMSSETVTEKILLRKIDEGGQLVGALVGSVLDSTAKAVNATISFIDQEVASTRSNPLDGSFVKILPPGQYKVKVEAEGYETKVFLVPVEARRKTKVVFELPAIGVTDLGALAGMLMDPNGQPLAGVIRFPGTEIREIASNPETGEFFATLPPGRYKIEVASEGYGTRDYLIPIEVGKKTRVDIKLANSAAVGAVAGRLLGPNDVPVPGVVKFADAKIGSVVADPSTGAFNKILPVGTYDVELSGPGYLAQKTKIQVLERKKTVLDFYLEPENAKPSLARLDGDAIVLSRPISMPKGATTLSAQDQEILDAVAEILRRGTQKVIIRAYTDDEGPAQANFKTTQAQADAVAAYLAGKGIDKGRITTVGGGEEKPLVPNSTPENRAQNRRVEFQVR